MHNLLVAPLTPEHATQAARLHLQGQPGTFLTDLGEDVLIVIYRALPQSPGGFGFAAVEFPVGRSTPRDVPLATSPNIVGYISATTGIGGLFVEMATQRLGDLLPPLLRRYRQKPTLALRSVQTALYPCLTHDEGKGEPAAELLSIMVEPALRSYGIGTLLMASFLQQCRNRSLASVTVTVDAANIGAQKFYQRHGFALWRNIVLYQRKMCVFRCTLW